MGPLQQQPVESLTKTLGWPAHTTREHHSRTHLPPPPPLPAPSPQSSTSLPAVLLATPIRKQKRSSKTGTQREPMLARGATGQPSPTAPCLLLPPFPASCTPGGGAGAAARPGVAGEFPGLSQTTTHVQAQSRQVRVSVASPAPCACCEVGCQSRSPWSFGSAVEEAVGATCVPLLHLPLAQSPQASQTVTLMFVSDPLLAQ